MSLTPGQTSDQPNAHDPKNQKLMPFTPSDEEIEAISDIVDITDEYLSDEPLDEADRRRGVEKGYFEEDEEKQEDHGEIVGESGDTLTIKIKPRTPTPEDWQRTVKPEDDNDIGFGTREIFYEEEVKRLEEELKKEEVNVASPSQGGDLGGAGTTVAPQEATSDTLHHITPLQDYYQRKLDDIDEEMRNIINAPEQSKAGDKRLDRLEHELERYQKLLEVARREGW